MRQRYVLGGVVLLLFVLLTLMRARQTVPIQPSASSTVPTPQTSSASPSPATVERVLGERAPIGDHGTVETIIDGDTFTLSDGRIVRLIGIDAPETGTRRPHECFAEEATTRAQQLLAGKVVELEKEVSEIDRYGRLLRYVYVGGVFVNDVLVREGYATARAYPPDTQYKQRLRQAEQEARAARRGLWGSACANVATASSDDKDCSDFPTRAAAQEFFRAHGGPKQDPYNLDSDRDGIACEGLPE